MKPIDRPEFGRLLTDVMAYYGKDTSKFMLDLWWQACDSFDIEQVQKALNSHAMDAERGVYAPKVADIVRALQGTSTDRAALAWGKVLGALGSVGAYQDVLFDDASIHASIVDCGGWIKMCRSEMSELSYLQHRFCQSYKAYAARGQFEYPALLTGDRSPDSEYLKFGRKIPRPAIVGNPDLASVVSKGGGAGGPAISFMPLQNLLLASDNRMSA